MCVRTVLGLMVSSRAASLLLAPREITQHVDLPLGQAGAGGCTSGDASGDGAACRRQHTDRFAAQPAVCDLVLQQTGGRVVGHRGHARGAAAIAVRPTRRMPPARVLPVSAQAHAPRNTPNRPAVRKHAMPAARRGAARRTVCRRAPSSTVPAAPSPTRLRATPWAGSRCRWVRRPADAVNQSGLVDERTPGVIRLEPRVTPGRRHGDRTRKPVIHGTFRSTMSAISSA